MNIQNLKIMIPQLKKIQKKFINKNLKIIKKNLLTLYIWKKKIVNKFDN